MKKILFEELNKTEKDQVEKMIKSQIMDLIDKDLEKTVLDLLKKELKGKDTEKIMTDISNEVLVSLYKTLWTRRNFWVTNLGK
jgi:translation initiation factor RLI1